MTHACAPQVPQLCYQYVAGVHREVTQRAVLNTTFPWASKMMSRKSGKIYVPSLKILETYEMAMVENKLTYTMWIIILELSHWRECRVG